MNGSVLDPLRAACVVAVLSEQQARESVDAGARFLVSPGTDAAVIAAMINTGATVLVSARWEEITAIATSFAAALTRARAVRS